MSATNHTTPLFIGYPTLEKWAESVQKTEPVYAMLLTEPGNPTQQGYRVDDLTIVCVQPDAHNWAHYCRILVGQVSYVADQPFGSKHTWIMDQTEIAWALVKDWLWEQAFDVREAALAVPVDYRFLNGRAAFLEYAKETGFFRRDLQPTQQAA